MSLYRITRTAAPRSTVVHMIDQVETRSTACGRRIGDEWAGEYTEEPTGDVTCKRCLPAVDAVKLNMRAAAEFNVGQRVGIIAGQLSVNGPFVKMHGNVVEIANYWNDTISYVVISDEDVANGDADGFVYEAWQLRAVTPITDDPDADRAARVAAGRCVDCDGTRRWDDGTVCPTCQTPEALSDRLAVVYGEKLTVPADGPRFPDSEARARCMASHPAGKSRVLPLPSGYANLRSLAGRGYGL